MKAKEITDHARRSAAVALVITALFFPLPYLRTFLLARLDDSAELLGAFALLVLLIQGIHTFFFPGGRNVAPAFLPKLHTDDQRSRFVSGYLYLVLASAALAVGILTAFPSLLDLMLRQTIDRRTRLILLPVIPCLLISALATSFVMGHMSFIWATLLQRAQLLCVTGLAGFMFVTGSPAMKADPFVWLGAAVAVAGVTTMIVAAAILLKTIRPVLRPKFPEGSFRFASFAYCDTIMVYAYMAIDQYFVVHHFGKAKLGVYFAMLLLARIIPLAVQQLGHLLLATFSKLLASNEEEALASSYRRVCRLTVGFFAAVSLVLIFFSRPLASIFGPTYASDHTILLVLAVAMNIDSLRTINGMTLMAYERMSSVFVSKLMQNIVQLVLTVALIEPMGIYGIVVAKGAGHMVSATALFFAAAKVTPKHRLLPPPAYFACQFVVMLSGWLAYATEWRHDGISAVAVVAGWTAVWFIGGFRVDDIRSLLPKRFRNVRSLAG